MLLNKIANVTPTIETEYPPHIVRTVHHAHETREARLAALAEVHKRLTEAGKEPGKDHNVFHSLIREVESAQTDQKEEWELSARSAVTDSYPTLNLESIKDFDTPEAFFRALHDLHGSELGASEGKALAEKVRELLGLAPDRAYHRAEVAVKSKTITAHGFARLDTWGVERVGALTLDNLRQVEKFMQQVMGEPWFSFRRDLRGWNHLDMEVSDFFGCKLGADQDDSIIKHVQLYKNEKARLVFKTEAGMRKFLRELGVEDRMDARA